MKLSVDTENIKQNLKPVDKANFIADMRTYIGVAIGYPVFITLAMLSVLVSGYTILQTFLMSTAFYIVVAGAVLYIRHRVIKGAYNLYVPQEIDGTVREDYSLLSAMLQRGEYVEADGEATKLFVENKDVRIPRIMGDALMHNQYYQEAVKWYQKGAQVASEPVDRLYFLSLLWELMETHIHDQTRAKMYMQMLSRDFPNTPEGKEAHRRLHDPRFF